MPKRNAATMDLQGLIFELGVYVCNNPIPYFVLSTKVIPGYKLYDNSAQGKEVFLKIGLLKDGGMRIRDGLADNALQLMCTSPS